MQHAANTQKSSMLTLQTYNYRIVQTGPRTYYAERWEFTRWWRSDPTELLETYPKTVEEAMWEDWRAVSDAEPEVIRT